MGTLLTMATGAQDAFGIVIFAVVGVCAVIAIITLAGSRKLYDQIGRGGLSLNEDEELPSRPMSAAATTAEANEEIRQMLTARNERRVRRGDAPLDIDQELARLTAPAVDPTLAAEVRDLVLARNARRVRRGEAPLDVDEEVARQLKEFG